MHELNKFEKTLLNRLAKLYPKISAHLPFVKVTSREFNGAGMYVNIGYTSDSVPIIDPPETALSTSENIDVEGLKYGLGYEVLIVNGKLHFIEIVTYEDGWDGKVNYFSIPYNPLID